MTASTPMPDRAGATRIAALGWCVILVSAGAAILPLVTPARGALLIGGMLILAGVAELFAGMIRHQTRKLAMLAGAITIFAGLLFASEQGTKFAPTLIIVAGWLFLRSLTLGLAAVLERGSVRNWMGVAAAADFILAVLVAIGLSAASLVISLFGPTQPMVAHFAWVLAISFVATGTMLLAVAHCARRAPV